ncbi:MFS transporter [Priestia filamentosa]|uniref:MFS transporter n=1 Tax=Priestia filamentosa TaxID=1402861 RepID=UPI00398225E4
MADKSGLPPSYMNQHLLEKTSYKWIVLLIATVAQTAATFVTYGMGPLATFYQQEYALSQFQTGLIVSAVNIGPIFSMLFFGDLMDKFGEKWIVGGGTIILGLNIFFAAFIHHYAFLIVVLTFVGVWYGTAQPGGSSVIIKWFPKKQRGLAMGIRQTGIPIGGALASAFLPIVFYQFHLASALFLQSFVAIIGGIIFLLFYKDMKIERKDKREERFMEKLHQIKNNKSLYPVFFIGVTMISFQIILVAHLMSYLHQASHIRLGTAGLLLSVCLIGGMIGRIVLAFISDTVFNGNRSKPLQLTILATVFFLLALIFLPSHLSIAGNTVLCFFVGFLGIGWFSLFIVLVSEKASSHFISLTVSFALTLNQLAIVLSPMIFGLSVDFFHGYGVPFLLLTGAILMGGVWLRLSEKKEKLQVLTKM